MAAILKKIQSLTFLNNINGQSASVTANAVLAIRAGGTFQYRAASGIATAPVKNQYNSQTAKSCRTILFFIRCHDEMVRTERGLHSHEMEAVTAKLQRDSALAMKTVISQRTGLSLPVLLDLL